MSGAANDRKPGAHRFWMPILSVVLGIAVGAVMLEGAARLTLDSGMDFDLEMWKYARDIKRVSDNPEIGHEHRPGAAGTFMGVPVAINSLGLRDIEFDPSQKPVGTVRTVMLGDSVTFGWGVLAEDTPSKLLETALNQTAGPTRYEVVNTGVGNYNTQMEVAYFLSKGYELKPDVVVLNYFINDAEPTPQRKQSWIAEHSQAYVVLASAVDKASRLFFGKSDWKDYYRNLYGDDRPGWVAAKDAIHSLASFCRENNIPLLVVNYPELHELKDYPFPEVTESVSKAAADEQLPFLDLRPFVEDLVPETLWVSPTDAHPNKIANERFAEAIKEKLFATFSETFVPADQSAEAGSVQ
jgi:lysophospholipase L1-like esterase